MPGTRRESTRHRSAPRPGAAVPVPEPLARVLAVAAPPASLLLPLAGLVAAQAASPVGQRLPVGAARFDLTGAWLAAEPGALVGSASWAAAPLLGRLQLGVLLRLLQAAEGQGVLTALQGALMLLAVVQAGLLWWLLRRLGRSLVAAGMAVAVLAIAPAAVVVHATASTAAVAAVWLVAAALLATAGGAVAAVAAGVAAGVAIASDPFAAVPVLVGAVALLRAAPATSERRAGTPRHPRALAAGLVATLLVLVAGAAALAAQPATDAAAALDALVAAQPGPALGAAALVLWATADPVGLLVAVVALVVAARRAAARPLAVAAAVLAAASIWPGGGVAAAPLVLLLAVAAAATAVTLDRGVVALGSPVFARSVVGSGWLTGVAALLLIGVVVALEGLTALVPAAQTPVARAAQWLHGSVPADQTVLVGLAAWPDLARAGGAVGWYADGAGASPASSTPWSGADYVVADAALGDGGSGQAHEVLARSVQVARFGSGADALAVRAVESAATSPAPEATDEPTAEATDGPSAQPTAGSSPEPTEEPTPAATPQSAAEREAEAVRQRTGDQLAGNPRIELDADDRALLTRGRVDTRIALVLAQLATTRRVTVAGFGTAPGDGSGIRTSVLISAVDGAAVPADVDATGDLLRFLSALRDDFATRTIDAGDDGVTASFPPDPVFVPSS